MQAVILAAGMGKRLKELTNNNTKCMVKVNGVSLIERMLTILDKKNLNQIVIVVGYMGKELIKFIDEIKIKTPIVYIENDIYDKTNNIYSLAMTKQYLIADDTLILESDLIFEEAVIDCMINDTRPSLALVDKYKSWMDGTCLVIDNEDRITDFITGKSLIFDNKDNYYKTVNIYKFSKHFSENIYVPFLEAYSKAMGNNEYYESVIKLIAILDNNEIRAKRLEGCQWYEIDDVQDLDIAESIFADSSEDKFKSIQSRYGGFWRYPGMLDFCYLVNPYFPPKHLLDEIKTNFGILATQYPSGQNVNSLLAGKYWGIDRNMVAVGNGAAEIINALFKIIKGKTGFIRPSFEEYIHRVNEEHAVIYKTCGPSFNYDCNDIIEFFKDKDINNLILINPDNPSGNCITNEGIIKLLDYCKCNNIRLIVDESFVDFAENTESIINNEMLLKYESSLIVIKSISKSYGIPGFRLGIVASGDISFIASLKKELSIWNINSFGEYFMQIMEKYRSDYEASLQKIKNERARFFDGLQKIGFLKVYKSEANYIMCQVVDADVNKLCSYLMSKNILIKDLTAKVDDGNQYIRLAVRDEQDDNLILVALSEFAIL